MRGPLVAPSPDESRVHDWLAVACMAATSGLFFAEGTAPRRRIVMVGRGRPRDRGGVRGGPGAAGCPSAVPR